MAKQTLEEVALEEAAKQWAAIHRVPYLGFLDGAKSEAARDYWFAKWQQEQDKNMYSEEDLREAFRQGQDNMECSLLYGFDSKLTEQDWFEQFKKQ